MAQTAPGGRPTWHLPPAETFPVAQKLSPPCAVVPAHHGQSSPPPSLVGPGAPTPLVHPPLRAQSASPTVWCLRSIRTSPSSRPALGLAPDASPGVCGSSTCVPISRRLPDPPIHPVLVGPDRVPRAPSASHRSSPQGANSTHAPRLGTSPAHDTRQLPHSPSVCSLQPLRISS